MTEILTYVLESFVCSAVLLAAWRWILSDGTSWRMQRFWLVSLLPLSVLIPLLNIPVWPSAETYPPTLFVPLQAIVERPSEAMASTAIDPEFAPKTLIALLYALGVAVMIGVLVREVITIARLRRGARRERIGTLRVLRPACTINSFSFLRTAYIDRSIAGEELAIIAAHEAAHIRRGHTLERLAVELIRALLWWNPVAHRTARRLAEIEEFEVDRSVIESGHDAADYMQTILTQTLGYSPDIASSLPYSLTKKRIEMMTTRKSGRYALLRTATTLGCATLLVVAFGFTARATEPQPAEQAPTEEKIKEVEIERIKNDMDLQVTVDENGQQRRTIVQHTEVYNLSETYTPTEESGVTIVRMPRFGEVEGTANPDQATSDNFRHWLLGEVEFPEGIRSAQVIAGFTVEADGSLSNIQIIQNDSEALAEQVRTILARSPRWTSAEDDAGNAVRVQLALPIIFVATEE